MENAANDGMIFKVVAATAWTIAEEQGEFRGAEIDIADGYIHFSNSDQVVDTVAKHFEGQHGLLLVAVKAEMLGEALRWEETRNGDSFPHLYGNLSLDCVESVTELPIGKDGRHIFRLP